MRDISILDCTLRDGGRIIDCAFPDNHIKDISTRLTDCHIDIIEVGFLRDKIEYSGNSTFFTDVNQIRPFVNRKQKNTLYVAFVDYGMFDFSTLKPYDGSSIDGLRVGFVKDDFLNHRQEIRECLLLVKNLGYKLFIQGVNSLGYSEAEYLDLITLVNDIQPYSFGLVDTYGAMYVGDVKRYFHLLDQHLDSAISIDFHSHNNFQLSFSFAQEMIRLCENKRHLIIDATLNGMGKGAGNLCTELIVDFLNRIHNYTYDLDGIFDIIDDYMYNIKKDNGWGYSIPSLMSGIYKSHPNNVIYLTEKYRLATKDIKYILSMLDEKKRQRYDYDNLHRLYLEYNHTKVNDKLAVQSLTNLFADENLLILAPGYSLLENSNLIKSYVMENNPYIVSVNFVSTLGSPSRRIAFFGSEKRYMRFSQERTGENVIIVSNIVSDTYEDYVVNYEGLIHRENAHGDNTMIMLLNLLRKIGITSMSIAGYDGFSQILKNNYFDSASFEDGRFEKDYDSINADVRVMLKKYAAGLINPSAIKFLTPSLYADIFLESTNEGD